MSSDKSKCLLDIFSLMQKNDISIDELNKEYKSNYKTNNSDLLTKIFSYIGASFVFSGMLLYTSIIWDDIDALSRVFIVLGPGIITLIMSILCSIDNKFKNAVTPFLIISCILQPAGIFVYLNEFSTSTGNIELVAMLVFIIMAIQQLALFFKFRKTSQLFFTIAFSYLSLLAAMDYVDFRITTALFVMGLSMLAVTAHVTKTAHSSLSGIGYFLSSILILYSTFRLLHDVKYIDFSLLGIAGLLMYISTYLRSRVLLTMSVMGFLSYLSYFSYEYFKDITGWPITLMILGFLMIIISSYAVKLGRKIS